MFTGFARYADGRTERLTSAQDLARAWTADESQVWVDIEQPTEDDRRAVDAVIDVDDEAWEDCLHGEQHPRIDEFPDYAFLVLYGAVAFETGKAFRPKKLAAFLGARFLITVHRESLRSISSLRERVERHPAAALAQGVDALFLQIADRMADHYVDLVEAYEARLVELEELALVPATQDGVLEGVLQLRRDVLQLRRVAAAVRELLTPIANGELDYITADLAQNFAHVRDHFQRVLDMIDAQRERLNAVRDSHYAVLTIQATEVMKTLTIFAAVLLPMSVIAGIFGMNLPLWPNPGHPLSFWGVLATMVAVGSSMLWYFRWRRWL